MTIKVSIDASGGDHGIPATIAAGLKALGAFQDLHLNFVGDESAIQAELGKHSSNQKLSNRFEKNFDRNFFLKSTFYCIFP